MDPLTASAALGVLTGLAANSLTYAAALIRDKLLAKATSQTQDALIAALDHYTSKHGAERQAAKHEAEGILTRYLKDNPSEQQNFVAFVADPQGTTINNHAEVKGQTGTNYGMITQNFS
ncbi:hypothetical protein C0Q98_00160 [Streptomyces albidoflavus]|uniref:hypothetical protein n=1 Tax=Streptomyces albidoflavus TaxID=1886 RepID=UPI00102069B8|nr:hypothetical protein [Streptomyces albidoflavus]NEC94972.1 hypothetical protein [Streptomyces albidoflavus]RZE67273.1 hypothetical protein C0Q98_00160 [Streptomyces albidoflavus]